MLALAFAGTTLQIARCAVRTLQNWHPLPFPGLKKNREA